MIMKKVLIICAAGMSSSLMAAKTTNFLQESGHDILIEAVSATEGHKVITKAEFNLYLISPQTKMHLAKFIELGKKVNRPVVLIPFQAYVPIPMGIEKLAQLVKDNL